ncbi:MAG: F0F1 ATP synthase subunit epsilon [Demequinaceae bacterium]|nr:F0F1 ATP synthase subunit epsilon [Demequinaceae bacterium]
MPISVDIVTPEASLFSGEAEHVSLVTVEGSVGLYPEHEPILSILQPCNVSVVDLSGHRLEIPIGGGFVSFDSNTVTVIADPVDAG